MTQVTQTSFCAGLLDADHPSPDGLTNASGDHSPRRYGVYRNNVFMSLREALGEAFPAIKKLIGEENFNNVAAGFLRTNPPSSPLMMHYGAGFPDYLSQVPQLAHIGYLADVAYLEQALRHAYHAEDAVSADPAELSGSSVTALLSARFTIAPAVQVVRSKWPVLSLYNFTMLADQPKPPARHEDVLVTRPEFDPIPHLIPEGAAALIQRLMTGATLGEAIDHAGALTNG